MSKSKILGGTAAFVLCLSLVACGQSDNVDLVPMDNGTPPQCVSVTFSDRDNWDGDLHNQRAFTYCLKGN